MPAHFHPHHMSTQTLILSHFANLKLAGDRVVRDAVQSLKPAPSTDTASRPPRHTRPTRRRRARRYRNASSTSRRVNAMSDADLEAELAARRAARARERERYAKAMRSEKLALLETELLRLRSEISRMDRGTPLGGGTPPTARWESLPNDRRSIRNSRSRTAAYPAPSPTGSPQLGAASDPMASAPPRPPPGAPQMPPPPPPQQAADPERQKRERAERQRRREEKKKQREAMKKPVTLADIIKSAGPNPASRLKPSGSTPLPDVNEPQPDEKEAFASLKDSLKKADPADPEEKAKDDENTDRGGDAKKDADKEGKDNPKSSDQDKQPQPDQTDNKKQQVASKGTADSDASKSSDPSKSSDTAKSTDTSKSSDAPKEPDQKSSPEAITSASPPNKPDTDSRNTTSKETPVQQANGTKDSPVPSSIENGSDTNQSNSLQPNGTQPQANGTTPNGAQNGPSESSASTGVQDATSALSALTAKLPKKTSPAVPDTESKPAAAPSAKRLSVQERRRLRRAAKESASTEDD